MKNRRGLVLAAAAVVAAGCLSACGAGGAQGGDSTSWTAYTYTTSDTVLDPMRELGSDTLPKITDGAVTMKVHPGGSLGISATDMAQAVGSNSVQFASDGFYHGHVPMGGILALPMLYQSQDDLEAALALAEPTLEKDFSDLGVTIVGRYIYPLQTFFTTAKVTSLDDLKGLKIRVSSPEQSALVQALGANPITIGTPEVPGALQQGVVDGVLTASSGGAKTYPELLKYNYRLQVNPVVSMLEVNSAAFSELTPEQQDELTAATTEMGEQITETMAQEEEQLTKKFESDGMVVTEPTESEVQEATDAVRDYWQKWASDQGPEAEELLNQVLEQVSG